MKICIITTFAIHFLQRSFLIGLLVLSVALTVSSQVKTIEIPVEIKIPNHTLYRPPNNYYIECKLFPADGIGSVSAIFIFDFIPSFTPVYYILELPLTSLEEKQFNGEFEVWVSLVREADQKKLIESKQNINLNTINIDKKILTPPARRYSVFRRKILFVTSKRQYDQSLYSSLYSVREDGTQLTKLYGSDRPLGISAICWSPDQSKIAFIEEDSVCMMNADGSNLIRFRSNYGYDSTRYRFKDHYPLWSSDGRKIAFFTVVHRNEGIGIIPVNHIEFFIIDITNKNNKPSCFLITNNSIPYYLLSRLFVWLPDSEKIVVILHKQAMIVNNGYYPQPITPSDKTVESFSLSPNGKLLVFMDSFDLYLINIDGTNLKLLGKDLYQFFDPQFSSDGEKILIQNQDNENRDFKLFSIDLTGSNLRKLNDPDNDEILKFLPIDGNRILYPSVDFRRLIIKDSDGSNKHCIFESTDLIINQFTW